MAENSISLTRKDPNEAAIRRRQKYAEMLAVQGAKDIEVADVGGVPTPISPFQGLEKVFKAGLGSYLSSEADKEEAAYVDARRKRVAEALAGAPGLAKQTGPMPTAAPATDEYGAPYSPATPEASAPIVDSGAVKPPRVTFNQKRNYYANMANSDDPDLAEAGARQLKTMNDSLPKMANVNPKDFTQDSFKNYMDTGEPGDLVAKPTGLKADLYDMFSLMGLSTKDIADSPLAQRYISGLLAKNAGFVTEADAADLAQKFVTTGVTRAAEVRVNPLGETAVPGMPSQQSAFSITPYMPANISQATRGGSYTLGQPAPAPTPGAVAQALGGTPPPAQRTAAQPVMPRPFTPPVRTAPMGQPAAVAPQTAPKPQVRTAAAPGVKIWQQEGFVPLVRAPNISEMQKAEFRAAQPAELSGTKSELSKLDSIEANIDKLLNEPGFNLITGFVGSKLPNMSSAALETQGTFERLQNQAKAFSVADMKASSQTGATGLGQITRTEYPMLRDAAARFVAADSPKTRREAMLDWKKAIAGSRGRVVDQYNSTYDPIDYTPPPVTTYRSPEADKALSDKVNKYRQGRR